FHDACNYLLGGPAACRAVWGFPEPRCASGSPGCPPNVGDERFGRMNDRAKTAKLIQETLSALVKLVRSNTLGELAADGSEPELTVPQAHALTHLIKQAPTTVGDLAAAMNIETSTLSRQLKELERKKLIQRR